MREQLSGTAARLFLERGFDAVRVAEVAEACGVSEKTVFNYFPTKEALLLDRLEATMAAVEEGLKDTSASPVAAALKILDAELTGMIGSLRRDPERSIATYRRFGELIRSTPSLRAYQSDTMDRFVALAAEILAARGDQSPDDPEPQIAAAALLGLWRVQFQSLRRHMDPQSTLAEIADNVRKDVKRAADLLETGLANLP